MTQDRKALFDVDIRQHVREAHALRARYMTMMLRSLVRSARARLYALAKLVGRLPRSTATRDTVHVQARADRP